MLKIDHKDFMVELHFNCKTFWILGEVRGNSYASHYVYFYYVLNHGEVQSNVEAQ
jgi:hypothetical protein